METVQISDSFGNKTEEMPVSDLEFFLENNKAKRAIEKDIEWLEEKLDLIDGRIITKVKYDGTVVIIEYKQVSPNGDETVSVFKAKHKPLPSFIAAFSDLRAYIEEICELPSGYCKEAIVKGVSFSHTDKVMGAVITVLIPLESANSPLVLNTPHLPEKYYGESPCPILPADCVSDLKTLIGEAKKYLDGSRAVAQKSLFEEELNDAY